MILDDLVAVGEPERSAGGSARGVAASREPRQVPFTFSVPGRADDDDVQEEESSAPQREAVGAIPIQVPPFTLLDEPEVSQHDREQMLHEHRSRVRQIDETLANFKLGGRVTAAVRGTVPATTWPVSDHVVERLLYARKTLLAPRR